MPKTRVLRYPAIEVEARLDFCRSRVWSTLPEKKAGARAHFPEQRLVIEPRLKQLECFPVMDIH